MKFCFWALPILGLSFMMPISARSESAARDAHPVLIAGLEQKNTCENETETYYEPFEKRVVTRTRLVCKPRPVPRNSQPVCRPWVTYQPNSRTGQIGSEYGQDCVRVPPNASPQPRSSPSSVRPGGCPNILRMAQTNPNKLIRREAMKIYRKNCTTP